MSPPVSWLVLFWVECALKSCCLFLRSCNDGVSWKWFWADQGEPFWWRLWVDSNRRQGYLWRSRQGLTWFFCLFSPGSRGCFNKLCYAIVQYVAHTYNCRICDEDDGGGAASWTGAAASCCALSWPILVKTLSTSTSTSCTTYFVHTWHDFVPTFDTYIYTYMRILMCTYYRCRCCIVSHNFLTFSGCS